jgi:hypothetical protein
VPPGLPLFLQRDRARSLQSACAIHTQGTNMNLSLSIGPLAALIAGILILAIPRLLNYIVAIYLILIGLLGLFGGGMNLR